MARMPLGSIRGRQTAAYLCIAAALVLVLLLGACSAYLDIRETRSARLHAEILRLRSHAERSVGSIENEFSADGTPWELTRLRGSPWMQRYWALNLSRQQERLYAAVVDHRGKVVAHSKPEREGQTLTFEGHDTMLANNGDNVRETRDDALSGGLPAVDVRVPILSAGREIGAYHAGLNADWLRTTLDAEADLKASWWMAVVSAIAAVVLLSSVSLYQITRRNTRLENELELAIARRAAEVNHLVLGVAHEIRNPLNAIRINLHTIAQVMGREFTLPEDELAAMLAESTREIERLEELMRELLGFARTDPQDVEHVELAVETQATLKFLKQKLDLAAIRVTTRLPQTPAGVRMNRARLRQVILNLMANASEAVGTGGAIEVDVVAERDGVELAVSDNGPGVPAADREAIFGPFFSKKAGGLGLGLALVRKLVEEAGGSVHYEVNPSGQGSVFRVSLPRAAS